MSLKVGLARSQASAAASPRPEKRPRLEGAPDKNDSVDATTSVVDRKKKRKKHPVVEPYSADDVLYHDVLALLKKVGKGHEIDVEGEWDAPLPVGTEVELVVSELSSTGDSLSVLPAPCKPWTVAVPFALPGEHIRARIFRSARLVSIADLLGVERANDSLRDPTRVKCKYFGRCAGCQYQMMPYEDQLDFKRKVIIKAYENFSSLSPEMVPDILPTMASPNIYGYRTKITPHFDVPRKKAKGVSGGDSSQKPWDLRIGFAEKGRRSVMDIEECPIATPVLNAALGPARAAVQKNIESYRKGATLLLRDSLVVPNASASNTGMDGLSRSLEQHVCITDHKHIVRERVGSFLFEFPAGSFFQNNNSILEPLTCYVRDAILDTAPTHLVDAYCGSGLFAITLSPHFSLIAGIEVSADSIRYARHNASLNGIPDGKCTFYVGNAEGIFESVKGYPTGQTVVVVDPPRKGCDTAFIDQLVTFGPATVIYVSCNVHTQARDVGMIVKRSQQLYKLESLRGFDLFPHTGHVETVAVLRRERQ